MHIIFISCKAKRVQKWLLVNLCIIFFFFLKFRFPLSTSLYACKWPYNNLDKFFVERKKKGKNCFEEATLLSIFGEA